jgi:hypothetical protein
LQAFASVRSRLLVWSVAFFILAEIAGSATAGPSKDSFGAGISGVVGLGTPVGLVGVEGRLDATPWVFLTAGVGMNGGPLIAHEDPAPQVAAMAHLRLPVSEDWFEGRSRQLAFSAGYGRSRGKHEWHYFALFDDNADYGGTKKGTLWWHNFELAGEKRVLRTGLPAFVIRVFAGVAVAGNPGDLHCVGAGISDCEALHPHAGTGPVPYFGTSAGFWFH